MSTAVIVAGALMASLTAYVLLGGADFGGGVWDLFATGPRRRAQRELVADAIGPIWEANHVWLILVVVLLFVCFPVVFSRVSIALHIPLTLMLVGIVLRGSAFTFRTYDSQQDEVQQRWGLVFSISSALTPILLGIVAGAIAAGRVPAHPEGSFVQGYVTPWLAPFPFAIGVMTLTLFAFLAAVYLTLEAEDEALREDFRQRALVSAVMVFGAAFLAILLARTEAPLVWRGLTQTRWALGYQLAIALAALAAIGALWTRRFRIARIAAALQATLILWGWALVQFPWILPEQLTIEQAAAPEITLRLVLGALILGSVVLVPSLVYLFRVFKTREKGEGRRKKD